jgi:probable F420-dependent oxidoreductase
VKIGVIYPQVELGGDPEAVRRIGLATEEIGYDHLLVYDHVLGSPHDREPKMLGPYTDKDPFHDPFVMLAYLAALTRRIELITGVIVLPQRQTALVARQAADVDLLSHERLTLGIGIGWNYVEFAALGQDFHTRGKRIDEQVGLLRALWSKPLVEFQGQFDRIDRAALNPRPRRSIPIWVGGHTDFALRRAARLADGFIFADGLEDSIDLVPKMRRFLDEEGRSQADFGLHCVMLFATEQEAVVERAARWRDIGGTHVSILTMGKGFRTIEAHLDYMKRCADGLAKAGLMAG